MPRLRIELVVGVPEGEMTLTGDGSLDVTTVGHFRACMKNCIETSPGTIHIDLTGVRVVTAAGIEALVELARRCRAAGVPLRWTFNPQVRRALDLVGLWWLGIEGEDLPIEAEIDRVLRNYAEQTFEGRLATKPARLVEKGPLDSRGIGDGHRVRERDADVEGSAPADLALDPDRSAHGLDRPLGDK
jgi:anti-anti-sigma factor